VQQQTFGLSGHGTRDLGSEPKKRLDPRKYIHAHPEIDYYQVRAGGKVDRYASDCIDSPLSYLLTAITPNASPEGKMQKFFAFRPGRYFGSRVISHTWAPIRRL
jgi:hypothetical protein